MTDALLSATSPATQGAAARNASIDLLRFFGAIAIVWFHLGMPHASLALSALPMFVILAVRFSGRKRLSGRIRRFMMPWFFWSMIYGVGKILDVIGDRASLTDEFKPWMLLSGPAIHLWFLPFMALTLLILARMEGKAGLWASAALAFVATNVCSLPWPFAQWLFVWPAVIVAVTGRYRLGLVIFLAASFTPMSAGALQTAIAIAAIMLAQAIRLPAHAWITRLNGLSLGIYLIHPLAASLCLRLMGEAQFLPTIAATIAIAIVVKRIAPEVV